MRYTVPGLLLFFAVTGCSKNSGNNNHSQGTLSAVTGSSAVNANLVFATYFQTLEAVTILGVVPAASDSTFIQLNLPYPEPTGQPISTDNSPWQLSYYTRSGSKSYDAFSGNGHAVVTFSQFDTTVHSIAGTFSGTLINDLNANDSIVVTGGKFTTTYSKE
ncbi:hypothetical protein [Puia sp.]|jgi:hypothetical protein|uniref:hypothetical protein n=1 Tax=Puia sp. TaxID=2045100 RepID=UPI002F3EEA0E